jgi:putative ATPase
MKPLAERMRPNDFTSFVGQPHLMSKESVFRKQLESGNLHSMIFWGPPGVGKTSMAQLIAKISGRVFFELSAINAGVKDLREVIKQAENLPVSPLVFVDEVHRFNKAQQDSLLGAVEKGTIMFIGATTENPSFEVISALLSRTRTYILKPLQENELKLMVDMAISQDEELSRLPIVIKEYDALIAMSSGDGRKLYNALEIVISAFNDEVEINIDNTTVMSVLQENLALYDKSGDMHFDIISAFIKSVRGSDPDAAIYYLARMLDAGEKIEFIARRMIILASEDIGLANPNALLLATQCFEAVRVTGMPEARIILSHVCIYLANSPKSNSAYLAIDKALEYIRQHPNQPVPLHLRNAPTALMKQVGYGQEYLYPHDYPGNIISQDYLPDAAKGTKFYKPANNAAEQQAAERIQQLKTMHPNKRKS